MPSFFNRLGSSTVTGTSQPDAFFAFTSTTSLDALRTDGFLGSLTWATAIRNADGTAFEVTAADVGISTDVLLGLDKSDKLYGSNQNDAVLYNDGAFKDGVGGFTSMEQFILGAGNDLLDLSPHGGSDYESSVVVGGDAGNDIIISGAGDDTLNGGEGDDLIFGYRRADTLNGGNGNDTLYGDDLGFNGIAGDDVLQGQGGDDLLHGGARADKLNGGDGSDQAFGGLGNDSVAGGNGDDVLHGDENGDKMNGDAGNDQVFGDAGDDELDGRAGDDRLEGGDGNDFLKGSDGNDSYLGGAGRDLFYAAVGADRIDDFSRGEDALDFRQLGLSQVPADQRQNYFLFTSSGADTLLTFDREGAGDFAAPEATVTLAGVDLVQGQADPSAIIAGLIADNAFLV